MKVRLIIPECKRFFQEKYCSDSWDYERAVDLLDVAITPQTDMLVTSHNFFSLQPTQFSSAKDLISNEVLPLLNTHLEEKVPLVVGIDLFSEKREGERQYNPYRGIDSIVAFLNGTTESTGTSPTSGSVGWSEERAINGGSPHRTRSESSCSTGRRSVSSPVVTSRCTVTTTGGSCRRWTCTSTSPTDPS